VRFWDTSALVPLVVDEPATEAVRGLLDDDSEPVIWTLTSVELMSALGRIARRSDGLQDLLPAMRESALDLVGRCVMVTDVDGVRRRAERLVGIHPLASADALQLAAALAASGDRPERLEIVTLDAVLARCARLEGFRVITPAAGAR
jgi:predicted nucleic acid-binding protein